MKHLILAAWIFAVSGFVGAPLRAGETEGLSVRNGPLAIRFDPADRYALTGLTHLGSGLDFLAAPPLVSYLMGT
ncbi:MAG: hypothetical protein U1E27_05790 [Kiritimatiellia bacterium]|nr:hypothetical protein [Kiritimatiellia bacterium]